MTAKRFLLRVSALSVLALLAVLVAFVVLRVWCDHLGSGGNWWSELRYAACFASMTALYAVITPPEILMDLIGGPDIDHILVHSALGAVFWGLMLAALLTGAEHVYRRWVRMEPPGEDAAVPSSVRTPLRTADAVVIGGAVGLVAALVLGHTYAKGGFAPWQRATPLPAGVAASEFVDSDVYALYVTTDDGLLYGMGPCADGGTTEPLLFDWDGAPWHEVERVANTDDEGCWWPWRCAHDPPISGYRWSMLRRPRGEARDQLYCMSYEVSGANILTTFALKRDGQIWRWDSSNYGLWAFIVEGFAAIGGAIAGVAAGAAVAAASRWHVRRKQAGRTRT